MDKQTENLLLIGGGLALLYYMYTNGLLTGGNAATPTEEAEAESSTIAANLNSMYGG